jgi:hypothetical protein
MSDLHCPDRLLDDAIVFEAPVVNETAAGRGRLGS